MQKWLMVLIAAASWSFAACGGDDSSTTSGGRGGTTGSGGAAGTAGTSSAGGAGGTTGGQGGAPADGGGACDQCKQTKCAAEIQACDADAPCKQARMCLAACAPDDGACKVDCLDPNKLPPGNAPFSNATTCFNQQCSTECM